MTDTRCIECSKWLPGYASRYASATVLIRIDGNLWNRSGKVCNECRDRLYRLAIPSAAARHD